MRKSDLTQLLIEHLTEKHLHLTENAIKESVDAILQCIIFAISRGERMEIRGFGSFEVKHVPERKARNPKTGESMTMSERYRLHFKAAKKLKLRLNMRS